MNLSESSELPTGEYKKELSLLGLIFLSLGDSIGSGLLFGSGTALKAAGPVGVFISFIGATFTVFILLTSLAEMSTRFPDTGGIITICEYYIDDSSAFAIGYNTMISKIAGTAASMQAISNSIHYWSPNIPRWVWGIVTWIWGFGINCLPVKYFSWVQSALSAGEVIFVFGLTLTIILAVTNSIGETPGPAFGEFWRESPFISGFWGFADAWLISAFAYDGSDDIATTAGEASETQKSLKRTIYVVFIVLVFVYGINGTFVGFGLDPRTEELGGVSPFTLILRNVGIGAAADVVNALVVVAIGCMILGYSYNQSRMMRELAVAGRALKVLSGLTSWGVPIPALLATMICSALVYSVSFLSQDAFASAMAMSGVLTLIDWIMVNVSLLRFRMGYIRVSDQIPPAAYVAPFWPWGQIVAVGVSVVIFVISIGSSFVHDEVAKGIMEIVGPVIIGCVYGIHKYRSRSKFVTIRQIEERLLGRKETSEEGFIQS